MAGYAGRPTPGLPPWGPEYDFNNQWDRRAYEIVLATGPMLVTLPATLTTWARAAELPRLRAAGPVGALLADQLLAHRRRNGRPPRRRPPGRPAQLPVRPSGLAVALGQIRATVEDTAVRVRPDGALDRDPTGHPVRLVTTLDGTAFNDHWVDTIDSLTTA